MCLAIGNEQGWGDGWGARTFAVWVWGTWAWILRIQAKLDAVVHVSHPGSHIVRREADSGSLWVRLPGGHSSWHIRDCLKQDGSRGLTPRTAWPPDMCHGTCMNTDTQTSGKQKNICESLKKTPVQLIFSQTLHSSTTLPFILKTLKILFHFSSVFEAPPGQKKQTQLKKFIYVFPLST